MVEIDLMAVVHISLKVDAWFLRTVLIELVFRAMATLLFKKLILELLKVNGRRSQDLELLLMLTNKVMLSVLPRREPFISTQDLDGKDFQEEPRMFALDPKELSGSLEPTKKEVVSVSTR